MSQLTPQTLRSTPEAQAWIDQFESQDRSTANFVLQNLILLSHTEFQNSLFRLLRDTRRQVKHDRPIALFAAREADRKQSVKRSSQTYGCPSDDCFEATTIPYFDPTDDSARPNATPSGAGIGSEGTVATLIRDLVDEDGINKYLDHPSIKSMSDVKCRDAFLVDDIIGSGKRMYNFADSVMHRATLKSWHSRHHLKITAVAYAGTKQGIRNVMAHRYVDNVVVAKTLSGGRLRWTVDQRNSVTQLCQQYATRTSHAGIPLGFGQAFTFLVFEHKCPNTAPPILWSRSKKNGWNPLFKKRPGTGFTVWPIPETETEAHTRLLQQIGQVQLAQHDWQRHVQPMGRLRLVLLAAVAKRLRKPSILADIVGITEQQVQHMLTDCVRFGWLTWDHCITQHGLKELAAARKLGLAPSEKVTLKNDFYFPTTLREAGSSI